MPQLKPVYLVHGDDHGAVAQRRAGLRALAEGLGEGTFAVWRHIDEVFDKHAA